MLDIRRYIYINENTIRRIQQNLTSCRKLAKCRKFQNIQWSTGQLSAIWKITNFRRDEFRKAENKIPLKNAILRMFPSIIQSSCNRLVNGDVRSTLRESN